jgi:hypothetical protein
MVRTVHEIHIVDCYRLKVYILSFQFSRLKVNALLVLVIKTPYILIYIYIKRHKIPNLLTFKMEKLMQGLDPMAISAVFSPSQYMGEKCISGMDCFVLKLSADQADLADRSDSTAEMIKHVIFGYFSQKNGLLVYLEDSYLTRIQSPGTYPTYWETTMATKIEDYRAVEGVMIAHGGQSSVMISRFGDNLKEGLSITRMEETWTIDDLAFDVPGLSMDCFIPPKEVQKDYPEENLDWRSPLQ